MFCVPDTVLATSVGVPPALALYFTYKYVTELAEVGTSISCPEFVTLPGARFTTGAVIPSASLAEMLNPAVVVVPEPAAVSVSFEFNVPIVVLY